MGKLCFTFSNFMKKNVVDFQKQKDNNEKIAEIVELPKSDVNLTINALVSIIISEMQIGHEITIPGLGTFLKQHKSERIATNPLTGQKIKIPSKNVPKFKAAKNLKEAVGLTQ